jgi:integrase
MDQVAVKIGNEEVSPHTAKDWFATLRVIIRAFVHEYELDRDPMEGVKPFSTRGYVTYTEEEPNSLTAGEVRRFLASMRRLYPQHFAMTALAFATGLRPSTFRPLRRHGPTSDVLWDQGVLLVRKSQTRGDEVMGTTKTYTRQRLSLPEELMHILRWHVDTLPEGPMVESDLLFPSEKGGFRAPSVLDKPFAAVAKDIGLRKHLTPRGMRRTFQDLAREAEVKDIVTRSISGHATEEMQRHYSTVQADEMRSGLAKVISLGGFREAHQGQQSQAKVGSDAGGTHGGTHAPQTGTTS